MESPDKDCNESSQHALLEISKAISIVAERHSGPLPHPESFKKYNETLPGAADRIMKMAEEISSASIANQKEELRIISRNSFASMVLTFSIIIIGFALAAFAMYNGKSVESLGIVLIEMTGLIYAFNKSSNTEKKTKKTDRTKQRDH